MVEKVQKDKKIKVEKWKNIKVPEELWREVKTFAAKRGVKIYQAIEVKK